MAIALWSLLAAEASEVLKVDLKEDGVVRLDLAVAKPATLADNTDLEAFVPIGETGRGAEIVVVFKVTTAAEEGRPVLVHSALEPDSYLLAVLQTAQSGAVGEQIVEVEVERRRADLQIDFVPAAREIVLVEAKSVEQIEVLDRLYADPPDNVRELFLNA